MYVYCTYFGDCATKSDPLHMTLRWFRISLCCERFVFCVMPANGIHSSDDDLRDFWRAQIWAYKTMVPIQQSKLLAVMNWWKLCRRVNASLRVRISLKSALSAHWELLVSSYMRTHVYNSVMLSVHCSVLYVAMEFSRIRVRNVYIVDHTFDTILQKTSINVNMA